LLNLIAAIDRADRGTVSVDGIDLARSARASSPTGAPRTSATSSSSRTRAGADGVRERRAAAVAPAAVAKERHERVALALAAVGLSDRADHLPKATVGRPGDSASRSRARSSPIRRCSSPTNRRQPRPRSAEGVLALLDRLNRERGKTIVMVTHDPRAAEHGTRHFRLDKGELRTSSTERCA
jgi:putative ABC transport system ATP-binding protein